MNMKNHSELPLYRLHPEFNNDIIELKNIPKAIYKAGEELVSRDNKELYQIDLILFGLMDRTVNLLDALIFCLEKLNIVAAGSLLRNLIENLALITYFAEHSNGKIAAESILKYGRPKIFEKNKLRNLRDSEIIDFLNEKFVLAKSIYIETSAFVHFSPKHIFGITKPLDKNKRLFEGHISIGNENWQKPEIRRFIEVTKAISKKILQYIDGFGDFIKSNL